jgi:hypothetical protein
MSEMLVGGPLEELELADGTEAGFSPTHSATFTLLTPCAHRPLRTSSRGKAVASSRHVHQPVAFVVPED